MLLMNFPGAICWEKELPESSKKDSWQYHGKSWDSIGGSDLLDAFQRFETLEFSARTILYGKTIGTPQFLTNTQIDDFEDQIPGLLTEMESVSYPSDEREKRSSICKIVHRACDQGLMISTYGTVSVRWRENDFLITPTNVPRWIFR